MDKYIKFVINIAPSIRNNVKVKVAIIDDGVDLLPTGLNDFVPNSQNIVDGCSFYTPPTLGGEYTRLANYFFSTTSHGTHMAQRILQMCPQASLYIARLDTVTGDPNGEGATHVRPTIESAIKVRSVFYIYPLPFPLSLLPPPFSNLAHTQLVNIFLIRQNNYHLGDQVGNQERGGHHIHELVD